MMKQQKSWETPQLIILARGTPEESVLLHCKRIGLVSTIDEQGTAQSGCDYITETNCGACQSRSGS